MQTSTIRMKRLLPLIAAFICTWTTLPSTVSAGNLEPPAAPAPTMRSLEEQKPAWNKIIPANQRFVDALDGSAVLDKETGLVWAKSPPSTQFFWVDAMVEVPKMTIAGRRGWRVPTVDELSSLIDMEAPVVSNQPRLPSGHPFQNVKLYWYWSSTLALEADHVWAVYMGNDSSVGTPDKANSNYYVWPVRGGR